MADIERITLYSYNAAGTNTFTQVTANPTVLYHVSVSHNGGSVGYLQIYDNGTQQAGAGTPDFAIAVHSGTAAAGPPSFEATRDISYGAYGRRMNGGLSYLWAAGATGTAAHGANAVVDITYRGSI